MQWNVPNDLPVFPGRTRRGDSSATDLRAALSVHPRHSLLRVRGAREDDVRELSAEIAVVALVHDEGILRDLLRVDIVSVQEVDELRLRRRCLLRGNEADVVRRGTRSSLHNTTHPSTPQPQSHDNRHLHAGGR